MFGFYWSKKKMFDTVPVTEQNQSAAELESLEPHNFFRRQ
jgi:hypothetical protein